MKFLVIHLFSLLVFLAPTRALADDVVSGTVSLVYLVSGLGAAPGNADLRVYFTSGAPICSGAVNDSHWAFVNANDPNYKGILALLLTAQTTGKQVTLVSRAMSLGTGAYCQIVVAYMTT